MIPRWLVPAGTAIAVAGAVHSAVNARLLRRPSPAPPALTESVSVLVPARNEARQIGHCVRTLLSQTGVERMEVVTYDDESSDETAEFAVAAADGDPRLRVVPGGSVPPGWLGKPHACAQLAVLADPRSSILAFVDADVRLAPHAVASTVDMMRRHDLDWVSPLPRLECHTVAERLVQPLLPWSVLTFLPLRVSERSRHRSLAVAAGQFLVVRRSVYDAAGGHAAVRACVLDDLALARRLRRSGATGTIAEGSTLASCHMYDGWASVRDGYRKSAWALAGGPARSAAVVAALGLGYLVPVIAAVRGSRIGAIGYAAGVLGRVVTGRATGEGIGMAPLAHPVSITAAAWVMAGSIRGRRRGTLRWKGRALL